MRIEFPARSPIGRVTIGKGKDKETYLVLATPEMTRGLRVVQDNINAIESGIAASEVSNIPAGSIAATNVQDALNELDTEKASGASLSAHLVDTTDAHAASAITNTPAGGISATTVQAAINELDSEKASTGSVSAGDSAVQAYAIQRANHTGTQTAATISDFSAAADARIAAAVGVSVQAYDADLTTWGGKTAPAGTVVGTTDSQALTNKSLTNPIFTGNEFAQQGAPTSKAAAATLTIAELLTRIVQYTGAAAALTLPTGASIEAGVTILSGYSFEFCVINTGSGTATITTAAGLTLVGTMTVTAGSSGLFRVRKTATDTYTVYRIS